MIFRTSYPIRRHWPQAGKVWSFLPACKKRLQTIPQFLDHLTEDILPKVIEAFPL
jgi:hypothetical protein